MKKSLLTIFALAIAIGPVLGEDEQDAVKQPKSRDKVAPAPTKRVNPPPPRPRPVQQPPKVQAERSAKRESDAALSEQNPASVKPHLYAERPGAHPDL